MATQRLTLDVVLERFRLKHGDKYDYSKVVYVNRRTPMKIICPIHGEFEQTSDKHYKYGCWECGVKYRTSNRKFNTDECIKLCIEKHGDRYSYDKVNYVDCKTKITITCHKHGDFEQLPINHYLNGHNCPTCANHLKSGGYETLSDDELRNISPAYLYHVTISGDGELFEKIGVTCDPDTRFRSIGHGYKIVRRRIMKYNTMYGAFKDEQKLHLKFNKYQYIPKYKIGGYTECYLPNKIGH